MTDKEQRDAERLIKSRERLEARVRAFFNAAIGASDYIAAHAETRPHWMLVIQNYGTYILVNLSIDEEGFALLPVNGRERDLGEFLAHLDSVASELAATIRYSIDPDPAHTCFVQRTDRSGVVNHTGRQYRLLAPAPA